MISSDTIEFDRHILNSYPSQSELEETDEKMAPSAHFYMCFGKKQIFARKRREKIVICTRGWKVGKIKAGYYERFETGNLEEAKSYFKKLVLEALEEKNGMLISDNDNTQGRAEYQGTLQKLLQL